MKSRIIAILVVSCAIFSVQGQKQFRVSEDFLFHQSLGTDINTNSIRIDGELTFDDGMLNFDTKTKLFIGNPFKGLGKSKTVSLWFKIQRRGKSEMLISQTVGCSISEQVFYVRHTADDYLHVRFYGQEVSYNVRRKFNQWHHIAITFDNSVLTLFIDGEPKGKNESTKNYLFDDENVNRNVVIGGLERDDCLNEGPHGQSFKGKITNVFLYGQALKHDDIKLLYELGNLGTLDELKKLDERNQIEEKGSENPFGSTNTAKLNKTGNDGIDSVFVSSFYYSNVKDSVGVDATFQFVELLVRSKVEIEGDQNKYLQRFSLPFDDMKLVGSKRNIRIQNGKFGSIQSRSPWNTGNAHYFKAVISDMPAVFQDEDKMIKMKVWQVNPIRIGSQEIIFGWKILDFNKTCRIVSVIRIHKKNTVNKMANRDSSNKNSKSDNSDSKKKIKDSNGWFRGVLNYLWIPLAPLLIWFIQRRLLDNKKPDE